MNIKSYLTKIYIICLVYAVTPLFVNAQVPSTVPSNIQTIGDLIAVIRNFVNALIPIAAGVALLGFFWGLAQYIFKAGDKEAKEEGKRIMIWGSAALFLIAAIGGIINLVAGSLGLSTGGTITPPDVSGP